MIYVVQELPVDIQQQHAQTIVTVIVQVQQQQLIAKILQQELIHTAYVVQDIVAAENK